MELRDMVNVVRQRMRLIAAMVIIAVLTTAFVTVWLVPPVYEAKAELIVNKPAEASMPAIHWDTVTVNLQLMSTYRYLAESQAVMDEVLRLEPGLPYTARDLLGMVAVEVKEGTQLITLRVRDDSPERAASIAALSAQAFKTKVAEIMGADHVTIISDPAQAGVDEPVGPNLALNVLAAFVLSLVAGLLAAFTLHHLDDTIRSAEDLGGLDVPVFAVVPVISKKASVRRQTVKTERRAGENAYATN